MEMALWAWRFPDWCILRVACQTLKYWYDLEWPGQLLVDGGTNRLHAAKVHHSACLSTTPRPQTQKDLEWTS